MLKTIVLLILSLPTVLFATFEQPFLTFSNATLSVKYQAIYGYLDNQYEAFFPVFSCREPQFKKSYKLKTPTVSAGGDVLLIVDDTVGLAAHYFHFMEHLIGIWNFLAHQDPDRIKMILFAFGQSSEQDGNWSGSNETTRILLTSLFPNAEIGLFKDLPAHMSLKADKIHISSRLRSHGIPASGYHNMNGFSRPHYVPKRLEQMRDRLFEKMDIKMEPANNSLRITYCKRSVGRTMDPSVEKQLLETIGNEPHCELQVVDFGKISFLEQLSVIANTDLFIGVHGNGLTHLLFLPDQATVLEYFEGGEVGFYRLFAQVRGLHYYGNSQERWVTESYNGLENSGPFQNHVTGIDLDGTMALIRMLVLEQ